LAHRSRLSRWIVTLTAGCACLFIAGCANSVAPPLPDLKRNDGDSMMSATKQQQTIKDLADKKTAEEAEALKKIQNSQ